RLLQTVPLWFTTGPAAGTPVTTLNLNFRDGWFYSVGAEYQLNPRTILRGGIAYEVSPVTDSNRTTILPDANRWWFSAGLTQNLRDRVTLDFGYSFIWAGDNPINIG